MIQDWAVRHNSIIKWCIGTRMGATHVTGASWKLCEASRVPSNKNPQITFISAIPGSKNNQCRVQIFGRGLTAPFNPHSSTRQYILFIHISRSYRDTTSYSDLRSRIRKTTNTGFKSLGAADRPLQPLFLYTSIDDKKWSKLSSNLRKS